MSDEKTKNTEEMLTVPLAQLFTSGAMSLFSRSSGAGKTCPARLFQL